MEVAMFTDEILIQSDQRALLSERYRTMLFDDVVPFWERHSPDREQGGFFTCLERDGTVYSGEKFVWMIARQTWMLANLHRSFERRYEWQELAIHGAEYLTTHAHRDDGGMYFRLSRDGQPRASCLSLYTECFTAMALAEVSSATGALGWWERAMVLWRRLKQRLGEPDDTPLLGYPLEARFHLHAHDMMRLNLSAVFDRIAPSPRWQRWITASAESIMDKHWKPELGALLENVAPDGAPLLDIPEGRLHHPGHALETAWMLFEVALAREDEHLWESALEITLTSLERGWDDKYGGIRYLMNIDGTPTHPLEADLKLWWVHVEALYTLLLSWAHTGRDDLKSWYERVHDYTFDRFPDPEHGEWFGYLNRDGSPVWTAKANGWKGCFHLPRALLKSHLLLREER